jgi:hypothetical protein
MHSLQIIAINHWSIFGETIYIALARPIINSTMEPDDTSTLCEFITLRQSPRPLCSMPPSLADIDVVDAHHSTTRLHHPVATLKTMPSRERVTPMCHHHPIQES